MDDITNIKKLIEEGKFGEAELALSNALRNNPDSHELVIIQADLNLQRGSLLWDEGDIDKALEYLTRALEINPSDRNIVLKCGEVLAELDRKESAKNLYSSYLQKHPDDENVREALRKIASPSAVSLAGTSQGTAEIEELPKISVTGSESHLGAPPMPQAKACAKEDILHLSPGKNGYPKISIITPSFNQGQFLEECIDSILSQNYPNLEYVIMDGGSTDNSVEIIKKYEKYVTYWQSRPDDGHYWAVNEGLKKTTGEIMGWLNSDDKFHPNGLFILGDIFREFPHVHFLTGKRIGFDASSNLHSFGAEQQTWNRNMMLDKNTVKKHLFIMQESTYWRRELWEEAGATLDLSYKLAGDYELWLRFLRFTQLYTVDALIAGFRYHGQNQRSQVHLSEYLAECETVIDRERLIVSEKPALDSVSPPLIHYPITKTRSTLSDTTGKPKISIVTPSFNQGQFLEACIDSILSQNYPNLEYIIMDGGSTDNSVEIIKKYEKYLTYWQSMPDKGQYYAINDGFKKTTGEIMTWLNSDDMLHPGSLDIVAIIFSHFKSVEWITGRFNGIDAYGNQIWIHNLLHLLSRERYLKRQYKNPYVQQEGTFWRRTLWEKAGATLDTSCKLAGDLELWARFFRYAQLYPVDPMLGAWRKHSAQKTATLLEEYNSEAERIIDREIQLYNQSSDKTLYPAPLPITLEQLSAPDQMVTNGTSFKPDKQSQIKVSAITSSDLSNTILVAANLVPFKDEGQLERQEACIQSISELIPSDIVPLNICYPDELLQPQGWHVAPELKRSANIELKVEGKRKPFVTDLFDIASEWARKNNIKWFALTNSDIIITARLIEEIRKLLRDGYETIAVSRNEVESVDRSAKTMHSRLEVRGYDVFVCRTDWWISNRHLFQPYIFGERAWDNAFAAVMACHSKFHIMYSTDLCFHFKHPTGWHTGPYANYNMSLYKGPDKNYSDKYIAFIMDVLDTMVNAKKATLSFEETEAMIGKHFKPRYKVSTIVSTYNSQRFIVGCLEDLLNQTLYKKGQLEIIVIDSGSQQNERSIIEAFQQRYEHIKYIRTEKRETVYAAWNRGIKLASGEYVTNANTDDRHRPDALEVMANELDRDREIALVYGDQIITKTENETFDNCSPAAYFKWPEFDRKCLLHIACIGPQPLWRKSLHDEFGYFREDLKVAGDYEWWLRISEKYPFRHILELLGLYLANERGLEYAQQGSSQTESNAVRGSYIKKAGIKPEFELYPRNFIVSQYESASIEKEPLVSVIIPTRDRPEMLKEAIQSVLKQTYRNFEIVIVNDGGADVSTVINNMNEDGNIIYIRIPKTRGVAASRNTGIRTAQGKYIAYLDDDDIFYPDHLKTLVNFLEAGEYQIAYTDTSQAIQEKQDGRYVSVRSNAFNLPDFDQNLMLVRNFIPTLCIMHQRTCTDEVGLFDESLGTHEDWDLWIRMSRKFRFGHIGKITCEFRTRQDEAQMRTAKRADFDRTRLTIYERYRDLTLGQPNLIEAQKKVEEEEAMITRQQSADHVTRKKVSIIVVTYNSALTLRACLDSVLQHTPGAELIVVDNASTDETQAILMEYEAGRPASLQADKLVRIILNAENKGFSYACNQGIRASSGEYVILLNPDTVVPPDWADRLIAHFEPGVGAVGPVSNYVAGMQKIELYLKEPLSRKLQVNEFSEKLYQWNAGQGRETKLLIGFCMAFSRKVLDSVGLLDDDLFLGNDDLDISWRLREHGYKLIVATDTFVYHEGQVSFRSQRTEKTDRLVQQSTDLLYRKLETHYGAGNVPTPLELWGIDWFRPTDAQFRTSQPVSEVSSSDRENFVPRYLTVRPSDVALGPAGDTMPGLTSVIILAYNQWDQTGLCLDSILKHTPEPHEIIVVDNGSTDGTAEHLRDMMKTRPNIRIIVNATNRGFAAGNNQGISIAKGDHVLLLNNDTIVTEGWLGRMLGVFIEYPRTGIVGPKSNHVVGSQLVPDVDYRSIVGIDDFAARWSREHEGQSSPVYRVIGFCLLAKREVIDRIGGLDEQFGSGNFEDDDFCLRAAFSGYEVRIAEDVFIHHTGGQTFKGAGIDYNKSLLRNWDLFKVKWGMPVDAPYEKEYRVPAKLPPGMIVYVPLPDVSFDHQGDMENRRLEEPSQKVQPKERTSGLTSLLVLAHDRQDHIRKCLRSIREHTKEPYEIVFVPAGCSNTMMKWLRKRVRGNLNYKLVESNPASASDNFLKSPPLAKGGKGGFSDNDTQLNYAAACNRGINESSGEYIVLLHDDVVLTEAWLTGMLECLNSSPDTGIVGPMAVNVEGIQDLTNPPTPPFTKGGTGGFSLERLDEFARAFREKNRYRRVAHVKPKGFCILFRSRLVEEIGLFDERFNSHDFAEEDYCLRSVLERHRNIIAADVFIHHGNSCTESETTDASAIDKKTFFRKWGGIDEKSSTGKKLFAANALAEADELNQKGQKNDAIAILLESLERSPGDRRLYFAVAEILIENKKFREAIELLEKMPEVAEQDSWRLEYIGYCKEGLDLHEEADDYAGRALALDKASARAWNLKGVIAFNRGLNSDAEQFFVKASDSDGGFGEAYANLGAIYWSAKETDKAFDLLEKATILSPTVEDVIINYHTASVSLSRLESAEMVLQNALGLYPLSRRLRFILIDILLQRKKYREAMEVMEDTISKVGVDDDILSFALALREKVGPKEIAQKEGSRGQGVKDSGQGRDSSVQGAKEKLSFPLVGNLSEKDRKDCGQAAMTGLEGKSSNALSLCMIVKNEEKNIVQCLTGIKPVVDEMIVVDTGSTDRTRDIAKALGAKVYDFKWTNDFSEARNFALSKASGKWILVLDADEVISPSDFDSLRKLVQSPVSKPVAYSFITRNYVSEVTITGWMANDGRYKEEAGVGWMPSDKVRLFPNDERIRFENPVHELVEYSMKRAGIEIRQCEIPIHHYGKLSKEKISSKGEEYYELGKKKVIEQGGKDIKALYELGVQASELKKHEEAVDFFERVTALKPDYPAAFYGMGNSYFHLGRYEDALASLKRALTLNPDSRDTVTLYSECEICAGDVQAAIAQLEAYLKKDPSYPRAMLPLATAYFCAGRKEKGIEQTKKLEEINFNGANYFTGLAKMLMSEGRLECACSLLEAAIEIGHANNDAPELLEECKKKEKLEISIQDQESLHFDRHSGLDPESNLSDLDSRFRGNDNVNMRLGHSQSPVSISLCMIVKNEEDNIERCLRNIKPLVDEMIVVDTGSTDRTKEIVKALGAKVYDFKWNDSFADARNFSLSKASGEWILILDADEVISPSDFDRLRELVIPPPPLLAKGGQGGGTVSRSPVSSHCDPPEAERSDVAISQSSVSKPVAYSFVTRNYVIRENVAGSIPNDGRYKEEAGSGWFKGEKVRLFPNDERVRFEFPVHERIDFSLLRAGIEIKNCDVPVHHYGKLDEEKSAVKAERYYALTKKKVAEQGEKDINALYELAVQAAEIGKYEEALEYLKKVVAFRPHFSQAFQSMGNNYFNLQRYEDALLSYNKALELDPALRDALLMAATCEIYTGNIEASIPYLERLIRKETDNIKAMALLAVTYFISGRKNEGIRFAEELKEVKFNCSDYFSSFAKTLLSLRRHDYACSLLDAAIETGNATPEMSDLLEECREKERLEKKLEIRNSISVDKNEIAVQPSPPSADRNDDKASPTSISLCMIVKNEEDNIERCLTNIRPLVDEMIVVDTGSTDKTKEIAQTLGAKVYDFKWNDSFADARNFSLSKASGKWILILDADEVIAPSDFDALRELVTPPPPPLPKGGRTFIPPLDKGGQRGVTVSQSPVSKLLAYALVTRNYVIPKNTVGWIANDAGYKEEAGTGWFSTEKVRLFPNDRRIHFENPVHELVEFSLAKLGIEIKKCNIPIHHYGTLDRGRMISKGEEYYQLGKKKLMQKGEPDVFALYELAVQAGVLEKYEEAIEYWQKIIRLEQDPSGPGFNIKEGKKFLGKGLSLDTGQLFGQAFYGMANAYFYLGRYGEALVSIRKAMEINPGSRDVVLLYSKCELCAGNAEASIGRLEALLEKAPDYPRGRLELAVAYLCAGRKEKGLEYLKRLKDIHFADYSEYLSEFAKVLISAGRFAYARSLVEAIIETVAAIPEASTLLEKCRELQGSSIQEFKNLSEITDSRIQGAKERLSFPLVGNLSEKDRKDCGQAAMTDDNNVTSNTSISLCMIVKNEEDNIERCLTSIKPLVNEMIVVDTGSTDKTKDIAMASGAKVYDFKWNDSFADARNFSLSKATGKWILILDADEIIAPSDFDRLKSLVIPPYPPLERGVTVSQSPVSKPVAYSFVTRNYISHIKVGITPNDGKYQEEAGAGWIPGEKVRLFPNDNRLRFENAVHELVEPSLSRYGIQVRKSGVPVHHYGKLNEEKKAFKGREYYNLGKIKLTKKGKKDAVALYELASQASEIGKYDEAIEHWKNLISVAPDFSLAFLGLGTAYFAFGRYDEAITPLKKALRLDPSSKDAAVMCSTSEICMGNAEAAVPRLEALLTRDPHHQLAMFTLIAAYFCAGRKEKGLEYEKKLKEENGAYADYIINFAKLLINAKQIVYAVSLLESVQDRIDGHGEIAELLSLCYRMLAEETEGKQM